MTTTVRSKQKLSRDEVRKLCKEHFELDRQLFRLICDFSASACTVKDLLRHRMNEIAELVGQDTLDDYEERQRLVARIENLERGQNALEELFYHCKGGLIVHSVATACIGLSALFVFLVHL